MKQIHCKMILEESSEKVVNMNLFDKIPENLFSILSSKNKSIYLDALFVVKESYRYELNVTRSDMNALLISKLESEMYAMESEGDDDFMQTSSDISSKANFLIRKLLETGWLIAEFRGVDFENIIELPDYSKKILDTLEDIMNEKTTEYNGLVVSTYNNLTALDRDRGDYAYQTLGRAIADTRQLIEMLKDLYQNIGRYHQSAIKMADVNDLLRSHFDDFQDVIVAKFLHPFKTFDSVPRFKGPIMEILNRWYNDEEMISLMGNQALSYKACETKQEAEMFIHGMISEIIQLYDSLPELMHEIDIRHNAYTRASIEKIQYLIHRDRSVKGNLVTLINGLKNDVIDSEILSSGISAYRQRYVTSDSLYARSRMTKSRVISSEPVKTVATNVKDMATEQFKKRIQDNYGREAVVKEILELIRNGNIDTSQMPLENDRDFSRIIMASLFGMQINAPYDVAFKDDRVENEKYDVPLIEYMKKEAVKRRE